MMHTINTRLKTIFSELQQYYHLCLNSVIGIFKRPFYFRDVVEQMEYTGSGTLGILVLVFLFIGMALSIQIAAEFQVMGFQMYTGRVVGIAVISEIGPVCAALVFAGRTGSGMASELGSMVQKNQIDTMRVFGMDPVKKLITPRILSALIMVPALTIIGDLISILGGLYTTTVVNNQSSAVYWDSIRVVLEPRYMIAGITKPLLFGFIIASISCYSGLSTKGGASGLKISTTNAFVLSTIMIIVVNFMVTKLLLILFGYS
ncbi:ABC transporter permease [Chitinispirillales bacterium ANBcel5]|uniref:MlaE family ABC transporter permease n=1 Tax=Cellulosispirillum alkaliphilum TaxID=3039283 RepID=UPI002A4F9BDD|nr:ABC transporter permease [Chitinispirillales bacterium ANBcel5]